MKQKTLSVWTVVLNNREAFVHARYNETREPLWPSLAPTKVTMKFFGCLAVRAPSRWVVAELNRQRINSST